MLVNIRNNYKGFLYFSTIFYIFATEFKPVYLILILVILFGLIYGKYIITKFYFITAFVFISFLIMSIFIKESDIGMVFNAILSILVFPVLYYMCKNSNLKEYKIFLQYSILYLSLEAFWRVTHPVYWKNGVEVLSNDEVWIYPYKMSSLMFLDSNFVALHIYCLLVVSLFLKLRSYTVVLFILILLTFSRSAIIGSILAIFLFFIYDSRYSKIIKPLGLIFLVSVLVWLAFNLAKFVDGSFLSKFYILETVSVYIKENFYFNDYLFGVGLANTYKLIGIGGHNIGVILFFETGIVGTIIYFIYFISTYRQFYSYSKYNKKIISIFLLIFLLMGFSLGLYIFPVMILTIAILTQDRSKYV